MYVRDMDSTHSFWPRPGHRFAAGLSASSSRLAHMINEFEHALRGTLPADTLTLRAQIRAARNKLDLWDLRADVHALVQQAFDQWEARMRLDDLNSLFDRPVHRSASAAV
jgi:hypothetical protein